MIVRLELPGARDYEARLKQPTRRKRVNRFCNFSSSSDAIAATRAKVPPKVLKVRIDPTSLRISVSLGLWVFSGGRVTYRPYGSRRVRPVNHPTVTSEGAASAASRISCDCVARLTMR